jgi:hypothetical protein
VQQAVDCGDLKPDTDPQQLVYEMYGLILALHHDARFLRIPGSVDRAHRGFARLIESCRLPQSRTANSVTGRSIKNHIVRRKTWVNTSRQCGICSSCCTNS